MTPDLSTTYLGLRLAHPVVASAGPLAHTAQGVRTLAEGGAAAVVLPSLFEEDLREEAARRDRWNRQGVGVFAEAGTYLPDLPAAPGIGERYLELVRAAKRAVDVPVLASLNGTALSDWVHWAGEVDDAGADALELNVYRVAADVDDTAASVERGIAELVAEVRSRVGIPVAVKLAPAFTALTSFAARLAAAGARGLVLFNRFYQPDIDLEELAIRPSLELSSSADLRLPLRWVAILRGRVGADLALSGGVHTPDDVVKGLLAGADVTMTTSSVLRHGPGHLGALRDGLAAWLAERGYASVAELRGSMAQGAVADPDDYERANYLAVIREASRRWAVAP